MGWGCSGVVLNNAPGCYLEVRQTAHFQHHLSGA